MFLHFQQYISQIVSVFGCRNFSQYYVIFCFIGKKTYIICKSRFMVLKNRPRSASESKLTHVLTQGLITELYVHT